MTVQSSSSIYKFNIYQKSQNQYINYGKCLESKTISSDFSRLYLPFIAWYPISCHTYLYKPAAICLSMYDL